MDAQVKKLNPLFSAKLQRAQECRDSLALWANQTALPVSRKWKKLETETLGRLLIHA